MAKTKRNQARQRPKSIKRKRGGVGRKGVYGKTPQKATHFVDADLVDNIATYYNSRNYENLVKSINKISKEIVSDRGRTVLDVVLTLKPRNEHREKHSQLMTELINDTPVHLFTDKTAIAARKADDSIKQKLITKTNDIDFVGFKETVTAMMNASMAESNIQTRIQLLTQMFGYIADSAPENMTEKTEKLMKVMRDKCNEIIYNLEMKDKHVPEEMKKCRQVLKALLNKWQYSTAVPISENSYKLLNRALNINLEDNCDEYNGANYRINLDGDLAFVYFSSIDDTGILKTIVDAIGCDPAHARSVYKRCEKSFRLSIDEETEEEYLLAQEEAEEAEEGNDEESNDVEEVSSTKYNTFYIGHESNAFRLLNRALNSSFTNKNTGTYNSSSGYTISLDFDIGYIYFDSIENKEFVKEVIQRIADIVGDEPNYYITECETGDEIRI